MNATLLLLTLNAAVTTNLTPDANHKMLNAIVLNLLFSDTLASGNLATLKSIAAQCPLEGGDAVYEARAFVTYLTGQDFDDGEVCASSEREQKPQPSEKASNLDTIVLYPNPTMGQVYWSGVGDQVVVLRVFNALGQLQSEQTVSGNSADVGRLPVGLYTIQIFAQDNILLATQKIQIVKN